MNKRMGLTGVHRPHPGLEMGPSISLPCPKQAEPLGPDPSSAPALPSIPLCCANREPTLGMQLGLLNQQHLEMLGLGREGPLGHTGPPRPPRTGTEGNCRCQEVTPSQGNALSFVSQGAAVPGNALSSSHHLQGKCRMSKEGSWGASPPKITAVATQCAAGESWK